MNEKIEAAVAEFRRYLEGGLQPGGTTRVLDQDWIKALVQKADPLGRKVELATMGEDARRQLDEMRTKAA